MQAILRLMTLMTIMLGGHVLTSCDGKVSPASSAGSGGASELAPGAPTAVTGTAGDSQVELTWSAPASNSGTSITVYVVQYSSDNGTSWTTFSDGTSTLTSATVTGLTNGTSYVFRVAAKNSNGTGVYSASSPSVTPAPTAPAAPASVRGIPGNAQVSLYWDTPAINGGSAITDYFIQYSSSGGGTWTTFEDGVSTLTTANVTGLTNGTPYLFRVAAQNSVGTGIYSESSVVVKPVTTPDAPTSVTGTAASNQVSLNWTAPVNTGGSAITNYSIQYSSDGGISWSAALLTGSTSANFIVTGLTNGTTYIFKVAAKNSAGAGNYSASSPSVTPATTPDAPVSVAGTAGNNQVALNWTTPASNGGSAITNYSIQYSSDGGTSWSTALLTGSTSANFTVTGLTNGTTYIFKVAAKNSAGAGNYSASSPSVTPATTPDAPVSVAGTAGNNQVALNWTAPASNGGSAITNYLIQHSSDGGTSWSAALLTGSASANFTVTGLTNGTTYIFKVAAKNSAGNGIYSTNSSSVTPVTTPGAPTLVTGTAGNMEVLLTWNAPANNGGAPITSYEIKYKAESAMEGEWSTFSPVVATETSATVTGLINGTAYIFKVAAVNSQGIGSYGHIISSQTPQFWTEMTIDQDFTMRDNRTSLWWSNDRGVMNWDAAESHCANLYYNGRSDWRLPTREELLVAYGNDIKSQARSKWIFDFTRKFWSGSTWPQISMVANYRDRAWNVSLETGAQSDSYSSWKGYAFEISVICVRWPGITPESPTSIKGTIGDTQVSLTWDAPASNGESEITDYTVQYSSDNASTWTTFSDDTSTLTSATVTGLTNFTTYVFRVVAINSAGKVGYSEISSGFTPIKPWSDVTSGSQVTMRDNGTNLWWSNSGGVMYWDDANSHCQNLYYNGRSDWRLPTTEELEDAARNNIRSQVRADWINNFNNYFWSGTWSNYGYKFVVNLSWGGSYYYQYGYHTNVLAICVREP